VGGHQAVEHGIAPPDAGARARMMPGAPDGGGGDASEKRRGFEGVLFWNQNICRRRT
jgi:hypothetical protein